MTADEVGTMNRPLGAGLTEVAILGNDASWFVVMVDTPPLQFRHKEVKVGSTTKYMIGSDSGEDWIKYVRTRLFFSFPRLSFFFVVVTFERRGIVGAVLPLTSKSKAENLKRCSRGATSGTSVSLSYVLPLTKRMGNEYVLCEEIRGKEEKRKGAGMSGEWK